MVRWANKGDAKGGKLCIPKSIIECLALDIFDNASMIKTRFIRKLLSSKYPKILLNGKIANKALAIALILTLTVIYVHPSSSNSPIGKPHIQLIYTLTGHQKVTFGVPAIVISPSGQTLISGGRDDTIKVWNIHTGKLLRSINAQSDGVTSIAISPDGKLFVSGGITTPTMKIWDSRTFKMLRVESGHTLPVETVAINPSC